MCGRRPKTNGVPGEEQQVRVLVGPRRTLYCIPFHATDRTLFVRSGLGAPTGRALPRRPAPRVVLLMLAHFLTGAVARPGYCNGQHANEMAFAVLDSSGTIHSWGGLVQRRHWRCSDGQRLRLDRVELRGICGARLLGHHQRVGLPQLWRWR